MKINNSLELTCDDISKPETIRDDKFIKYLTEIGVTDMAVRFEQGSIVLSAKDGNRVHDWCHGDTLNRCFRNLLYEVKQGRFRNSFMLLEDTSWNKNLYPDNIVREQWSKSISTLARVKLFVDIDLVRLTYFTAKVYTDQKRCNCILSIGGNDSGGWDSIPALFDRIREAEKALDPVYRGLLQ